MPPAIQLGQRVIIIGGLNRGRLGTITKVRQDVAGFGEVVLDVVIDGTVDPMPYLTSQLSWEGAR